MHAIIVACVFAPGVREEYPIRADSSLLHGTRQSVCMHVRYPSESFLSGQVSCSFLGIFAFKGAPFQPLVFCRKHVDSRTFCIQVPPTSCRCMHHLCRKMRACTWFFAQFPNTGRSPKGPSSRSPAPSRPRHPARVSWKWGLQPGHQT